MVTSASIADWLFAIMLGILVIVAICGIVQGHRSSQRMDKSYELLREWLDYIKQQDLDE